MPNNKKSKKSKDVEETPIGTSQLRKKTSGNKFLLMLSSSK
jgi:hypothetical protein